jgi:tRNA-dihydrouridine synthase 3
MEACEAPMTEPSEASMPADTKPQKKNVVLLYPDGAPEETADATAARLDELKAKHIQPIKREYLVDTSAGGGDAREEKSGRGQNKKRPVEKPPAEARTAGDPAGLADETSRVPFDVQLKLRKREYKFLTARGATEASTASAPPLLKERKLVDFSGKVYVAPLTTVGNLPFRRVLTKYGADITCGEMALCPNLNDGQSSEWALLRRHKDEKCFGVQLSAAHGDQFGRACEVVDKYGDVDFVDLNMGCPIDLVCSKGGGAALMRRNKKVRSILEMGLERLSVPMTLKMRTGWDEDPKLAHTMAGYAQAWAHELGPGSVACVFVHGRSRTARYSRAANWAYVETVAKCQDDAIPKLPIIGNGDIMSYADWEEKRKTAPSTCDCAMLARGALIKPWLPTELHEKRAWDISASERLDILRDFAKFGLDHWGADDCGVGRCRRFLLEWLSFLHRYTPVGLLERLPQRMNDRPPKFVGRNDLETLMASDDSRDWVTISEMLLGKVPEDFSFTPKHKANSYAAADTTAKPTDWG